jgi:hypothetical protein
MLDGVDMHNTYAYNLTTGKLHKRQLREQQTQQYTANYTAINSSEWQQTAINGKAMVHGRACTP